jgi:hypothetical protein
MKLLERACLQGVSLTMLVRDPLTERDTPMHVVRMWRDSLRRLTTAGATIRVHPHLHAKVYLFELSGGRTLFAVGSSNLTFQGMGFRWAECNVRGFHGAEFELVSRHAGGVMQQRLVATLDEWEAIARRERGAAFVQAVLA